LRGVCDFAAIEPNPIPIKAVLALQGVGHGLRLPLTPLSPEHADTAAHIVALVADLERTCRESVAA
jgi:4-hydroxy-tetrahydrodipicolinate synthase